MSSSLGCTRSLLWAMGAALVLVACGGGGDDAGPQIGVHQWPVSFGNFRPASEADNQAAPELQQFELIVMNLGGGTLEITGLEVRGDVNCSIQDAPAFDVDMPVQLTKSDQSFLRWSYLPGGSRNADEAGSITDQISIALTSNSSDSTLFEVSTCGCILAPGVDPENAPQCPCNLNEVPQTNCGG